MPIDAYGAPLLPGYDCIRHIGSGASAMVYLFRQHSPNRLVTVKIARAPINGPAFDALERETRLLGLLPDHPYILPAYGTGTTRDGRRFIISAYAPGGSYAAVMRAKILTCEQVLRLGIRMAGALESAHRAGIIHHDIKPSNILISDRGLPALTDFGIATRIYDRTPTGYSPHWAAPEVLLGKSNGNERSDVYSLAATLYALLAGSSPYEHGYAPANIGQLIELSIRAPLPTLGGNNAPQRVAVMLERALAKDPGKRPRSMEEFGRGLQHEYALHCNGEEPLIVSDPRDGQRSGKAVDQVFTDPIYPKRVHSLREPLDTENNDIGEPSFQPPAHRPHRWGHAVYGLCGCAAALALAIASATPFMGGATGPALRQAPSAPYGQNSDADSVIDTSGTLDADPKR